MLILDDTSELPPLTPERRKAILAWHEELIAARSRLQTGVCTDTMPEMPEKRRPIEAAWDAFAAVSLVPETGASQRADMKVGFYAGANALFSTLKVESGLGEFILGNLSFLTDVNADLDDFFRRFRKNQSN